MIHLTKDILGSSILDLTEKNIISLVSFPWSHHPQNVLLAQFSLHVHKCGLKPHSFHLYTILQKRGINHHSFIHWLIDPYIYSCILWWCEKKTSLFILLRYAKHSKRSSGRTKAHTFFVFSYQRRIKHQIYFSNANPWHYWYTSPSLPKHLYNICTTSAQLFRRWSNSVQML